MDERAFCAGEGALEGKGEGGMKAIAEEVSVWVWVWE